jgi:hypothetical protein
VKSRVKFTPTSPPMQPSSELVAMLPPITGLERLRGPGRPGVGRRPRWFRSYRRR